MPDPLSQTITSLLVDAEAAALTPEVAAVLRDTRHRLDGPLRLAFAGKVKAGKSTLLNALLGESLAPTDAGECTRIVTWYHRADRPQVVVHPLNGSPEERPYDRASGALEVNLGSRTAQTIDHIDIGWPTRRLRDVTLIDTPGLASISADVSARTVRALASADGQPSVADAVLYLLRHTHASDVRFLEAFHDDELAHGTSMNAVGVLARADEIGACRLDAMEVSQRIALRYQQDPRLRRLCPVVVPVSGLLGHGGQTLTQSEYAVLRTLASGSTADLGELLLTADRFASRVTPIAATEIERRHLMQRLGLFGVRLAVQLLRAAPMPTASELSAALVRESGLERLRAVLLAQFTDRSRVLKARSALATLNNVLADGGCAGTAELAARTEAIAAGAHAFVEVRLLNQLRTDNLELKSSQAEELDRLLGGAGHDPVSRLGLTPGAPADEIRTAALELLDRWRRVEQHPISSRPVQLAARVASRSLEGLLAEDVERRSGGSAVEAR